MQLTNHALCLIVIRKSRQNLAFSLHLHPLWRNQYTRKSIANNNTVIVHIMYFKTKCPCRIPKLWCNIIFTEDLRHSNGNSPIVAVIEKRKLAWLGHGRGIPNHSLPKTALRWALQRGEACRGRPKETRWRLIEKEASRNSYGVSSWARKCSVKIK